MKITKLIYLFLTIGCSVLFIFISNIPFILQVIIILVLGVSPIFYCICHIIMKSISDSWLTSFLDILVTELSNDEFIKIISNNFLISYNHTLKSAKQIIDNIYKYAIKNLSCKSVDIVTNAINKSFDNIGNINHNELQKLRIKDAINMKLAKLYYYYVKSTFNLNNNIQIKDFIKAFIQILPIFSILIFYLQHNIFTFFLIPLSIIVECLVYNYISNTFKFSLGSTCCSWFAYLLFSVFPPILLSYEEFHTFKCFSVYVFYLLILIISGLWLTNRVWTSTTFEDKNKGSFISTHQLLNIIEIKSIIKLRFLWLWITFFAIIIVIVMVYAIAFHEQNIYIGNLRRCTLYSISIFFGETPPISESINAWYLYSETIVAFLINTLYLANIVRLIFEPKISKKATQ